MRVGPGVPHKLERVACVGVDVEATCCCALVTVYVGRPEGCGFDEAKVLVERVPASSLGAAVGGRIPPDGVGAFGEGALDVHACDKAMGGSSVEERSCGAEEEDGGVHCGVASAEYNGLLSFVANDGSQRQRSSIFIQSHGSLPTWKCSSILP